MSVSGMAVLLLLLWCMMQGAMAQTDPLLVGAWEATDSDGCTQRSIVREEQFVTLLYGSTAPCLAKVRLRRNTCGGLINKKKESIVLRIHCKCVQ